MGALSQCSVVGLGSPSPGGGQRATEEVLQRPHAALRAKPTGLLSWALRWEKGWEGWWEEELGSSPLPTWLSWRVDAGKKEACVSNRSSTCFIHTSEMLGDPSLHSRKRWPRKEI